MPNSREASLSKLRAELRRVFDAEFRIHNGREPFAKGEAPPAFHYAPSSGLLTLLTSLDDGEVVVAVGRLEGGAEPWISRLADEFLARRDRTLRFAALEEQLTASVSQISQDFEEQSYLRFLAEQIEICEVSRDVEHVVARVAPRLRRVVHAEAVFFVPAAAASRPDPSGRLIRSGLSSVSDELCLALVRKFQAEAARAPVVRNLGFSADESTLGPGVRNFLCVHVEKDATKLGWLAAFNRGETFVASHEAPNGFGTVEAGLMQVTALMLATHARNVELFRETEALTVGVVRALVSAIEARDSYTRGHSERIALLARRLAQELGLNEDQCERIYVAGLLHDVGKIGVADEVLQKPGPLTPEEFAEIQKHPDIGYSILMDLKRMEYLLPGVLHHHERFDGAGYPDGLSGEEIPLQARILAVVDAWDAMSSARPYRQPLPRQKAAEIIVAGRGTQWDPEIVDAFARILEEVEEIARTHQSPSLGMRRRRAPSRAREASEESPAPKAEPVLAG
jgi:HD-GYP domain-containing protein (c-di-GMP phosphodiesterase class II)